MSERTDEDPAVEGAILEQCVQIRKPNVANSAFSATLATFIQNAIYSIMLVHRKMVYGRIKEVLEEIRKICPEEFAQKNAEAERENCLAA